VFSGIAKLIKNMLHRAREIRYASPRIESVPRLTGVCNQHRSNKGQAMLSISQWLAAVHQRLLVAKSNRRHLARRRPRSWSQVPAVVEVLEPRRLLSAVGTDGLAEEILDQPILQ